MFSSCPLSQRNMKCDLSAVNTENDGSLFIHQPNNIRGMSRGC